MTGESITVWGGMRGARGGGTGVYGGRGGLSLPRSGGAKLSRNDKGFVLWGDRWGRRIPGDRATTSLLRRTAASRTAKGRNYGTKAQEPVFSIRGTHITERMDQGPRGDGASQEQGSSAASSQAPQAPQAPPVTTATPRAGKGYGNRAHARESQQTGTVVQGGA